MSMSPENLFADATPQQRVLLEATLAALPEDASKEMRAKAMWALVEKLRALREFERWDPRYLESVVQKENYREVERLN